MQRRRYGRELLFGTAAGVGLALLCYVAPGTAGLVAELEYRTIDWRFHLRGPRPAGKDIVIVAIDQEALSAVGRWPWPRQTVAKLLDAIQAAGPRLVALDILFAEPAPGDDALGDTVARLGNVFVPVFISSHPPPEWFFQLPQVRRWQRAVAAAVAGGRGGILEVAGLDVPVRGLAKRAAGVGVADLVGSADGVYREIPLVVRCRDVIVPSLPVTIAAAGAGWSVSVAPGRHAAVGPHTFPIDVYGLTLVDFAGPSGTFQWVSAAHVLARRKEATEQLAGRIVLIGATAPGLFDLRPCPFDPQFRGVEALANAVENLLTGRVLSETNEIAELVVAVALSVVAAIQIALMPIGWGWAFALAAVAGYWLLALRGFVYAGVVLPLVTPAISSIAATVVGLIVQLSAAERQRQRTVEMFRRFVPPQIADCLVDEDLEAAERGQRRVITVMFADIRNSTTYARRLDPEAFVDALNGFFQEGHSIVWEHGGTLDKFIGDAILAFFNAPQEQPDHAARAVRAALKLVQVVKLHRDMWEFYGLPDLSIGVGIATGEAVVGCVGSRERMQYTAMGPTVHMAARLEELAKSLGVAVLVSEETYRAVANSVEARDLGVHQLRGFDEPVHVYEVLSIK
ncbi:MAG: adenylate/guanylate cyclase domain-containing protein [Armatimonadetes bacterium]|nr:adenylate/guanylate cyclase domain-containing protein [Armatimonadota bacterium]